jgi:CRISPR-associated protein Cmr1
MMTRETYDLELTTPCFLGGASGVSEWRAASVRGQLRWWFRAVAGGERGGDLAEVRRLEDAVFGTTGQSSAVRIFTDAGPEPRPAGGSSPFGKRLKATELASLWGDESADTVRRLRLGPSDQEFPSDPVHYLAFGPIVQGRLERPCLIPGGKAQLQVQWVRGTPEGARELFDRALRTWLRLGGIGARSRKGFGSLHLLTDTKPEDPRGDFMTWAGELLAGARAVTSLPQWTHVSSRSRIFVATQGQSDWLAAMVRLGAWLMAFRRRYGYPEEDRVAGGVPLKNRDYEWVKRNRRGGVPDRAGFGLPLPFGKAETVIWDSTEVGDARRASPLLLHVARFGDLYFPVLTHLPAAFLPAGAKLLYRGRSERPQPPTALQLDVVDRFLDDLIGKKLIEAVS